ncbi:MAG: ATP-binding domain-containing protein, partial [Candidatus Marinimicrobia bacterium]|nr:ATP-binding domain-containing protein [Candidatus Neomarinimicrobiota bacterium]
LKGFIEEVSLLTAIDSWNDQENRVTLMTLHSAKGLEFPIVFITGLEDGLFPLYRSLDSRKELEEERRLFYVGLTRAKDRVYLLYATHRRRMGTDYDLGLMSRFLREIPEEYLEEIPFSSALTRKVIRTKPGVAIKVRKTRTVTTFDDFKIGDNVEHAIFGVGVIKALSGTGENQRVGVVFKDGLKKKLIVKYANLKKNGL